MYIIGVTMEKIVQFELSTSGYMAYRRGMKDQDVQSSVTSMKEGLS